MDITKVNLKIKELLTEFESKDLPKLPNLNGIFDTTDITYAVISGQTLTNDINIINVKFNVSIAATIRMIEDDTEEIKNLYGLMSAVVYKLQKQKVKDGGLIRLTGFENFTPESGKWRSLLTFDVDIAIVAEKDFINCLDIFN